MMPHMEFADRAARNEEIFRGVNEQIQEGAELHDVTSDQPFHCECARADCTERLMISPQRYQRILAERYCFALVPGHELAGVERVVEEAERFIVVEKIGEARAQLDRDHPQSRF